MAGRDRMKGGESCLDNVRDIPPVRPRKHGPEVRKTPRWSAEEAGVPVTRHAAPPKVPELLKRLSGAPLPHGSEGRKRTADPTPDKQWGR